MRLWGKTKQKGGAEYEVGTCFLALDASEKYQSQIHRPQEDLELAQSLLRKWQMFLHREYSLIPAHSTGEYPSHTTLTSEIPSKSQVTRTTLYYKVLYNIIVFFLFLKVKKAAAEISLSNANTNTHTHTQV